MLFSTQVDSYRESDLGVFPPAWPDSLTVAARYLDSRIPGGHVQPGKRSIAWKISSKSLEEVNGFSKTAFSQRDSR